MKTIKSLILPIMFTIGVGIIFSTGYRLGKFATEKRFTYSIYKKDIDGNFLNKVLEKDCPDNGNCIGLVPIKVIATFKNGFVEKIEPYKK